MRQEARYEAFGHDQARDPGLVARMVRDHLLDPETDLLQIEPVYSRYKGEDGGMVTYRVSTVNRDGRGGGHFADTYVTARTGPSWRLRSQFERFDDPAFAKACVTKPMHLDLERGLLLLAFPLDRALPDLRKIVRAKWMRRWLEGAGILDARPDARVSLSHSRVSVESYRPERRAVLRFEAVSRHRPSHVWFLRLHSDSARADASSRALTALRQWGLPVPGAVGRPVAEAVVESAVPGRPLRRQDLLRPLILEEVGRLLARVHRVPAPEGLLVESVADVGAMGLACVEDLATVHEGLADRARELARGLGTLPLAREQVLLHGDLHPQQLLRDGVSVWLIDWDRARVGDPAFDLGTLAARLEVDFGTEGRQAFGHVIAGYAEHRAPPGSDRMSWHRSQALLRLVNMPYRRVRSDWISRTGTILNAIEERIAC